MHFHAKSSMTIKTNPITIDINKTQAKGSTVIFMFFVVSLLQAIL